MGILTIPEMADINQKKEIDPEMSISQEQQRCFLVLDFDTRFLGMLSGQNFEKVAFCMHFKNIKAARSTGVAR